MPTNILVITVAAIPADIPDYDRGDWKHWVDEDGDCQDARQEVLIAESLVAVTYETDRKCRSRNRTVVGAAPGTPPGATLQPFGRRPPRAAQERPSVGSLGMVAGRDKKRNTPTTSGEETHLIAISSRHNRSKGARGPEEWAPPDNALWCQYATGTGRR